MTAAVHEGSAPEGAAGPLTVLLVGSIQAHSGKSALAAALAVKLAYEGRRMLALRMVGGEDDVSAAPDAAYFRTLPFARGRGGSPLATADVAAAAAEQRQAGGLLIVEAPFAADLPALAAELQASVIVTARSADAAAMQSISALVSGLAERFLGVVAMAVPGKLAHAAASAFVAGRVPLLGVIPEDATLYAPNVLEIADALDAEIVLGEPSESQIIERLLIGSITTDPGQPYYARSRSKRAVITRSDKTDLQLAAMHTDIDCLILTGGVDPSPYTIDRAADDEIMVMLTKADTRGAVKLLEDIFLRTRFCSEEKLERMQALLEQHLDWAPIRRALGRPA